MTQEERVTNYIDRFGSITPLNAFNDLGITKLATVISNMKKKGTKVFQNFEASYNRFGEPVHYMRYWLDEKKYHNDMNESYHHIIYERK